jgi:hypothetical protein
MNIRIILFYVLCITIYSCKTDTNTKHEINTPQNGDLTGSFNSETEKSNKVESIVELTPEEKLVIQKKELIDNGWNEDNIKNGQMPSCYNFVPKRGDVDNYLSVSVGTGTDVTIKIMKKNVDECIRYVFINSGTTYKIKNIPEGKYYLKIAYGKDWLSKIENNKCIGKFLQNPMYEKGKETLDYNVIYTKDGSSIPSYSLELDVVSSSILNSFDSQNISEEEFNK